MPDPETGLAELHALRSDLARKRPGLPAIARPFASNLIEQIGNVSSEEDLERLRPYMAYQMQRLAEASGTSQ